MARKKSVMGGGKKGPRIGRGPHGLNLKTDHYTPGGAPGKRDHGKRK
jgi:hypothetical protein